MKKDYNTKKKATIIALSLTAVCLAGGLFYYVGTLGGGSDVKGTDNGNHNGNKVGDM